MIRITERHMVGGSLHEHIAAVRWVDLASTATGEDTREAMVEWIDGATENQAIVGVYPTDYAFVGTVHPDNRPAYLRTYADGEWNDNLLALPTY